MKEIHIECNPDELLVKCLGFSKKYITHHKGKSRIFKILSKEKNQLAIVDEDPGSHKTGFENSLILIDELNGFKYFIDNSGNKIFVLGGKLEDWIVSISKKQRIRLSSFGLPDKPHELKDVINHRLTKFNELVEELIRKKNPAMLKLRSFLK